MISRLTASLCLATLLGCATFAGAQPGNPPVKMGPGDLAPASAAPKSAAPKSAAPKAAPTSAAPKAAPTSVAPKAAPTSATPKAAPKSAAPKAAPKRTDKERKAAAEKKKAAAAAKKKRAAAAKKKAAARKRAQRKKRGAKLCKYASPIHKHLIIPGENVGDIAGRYGVTIKDLRRWNRRALKNPNRIRDGRTLRVCPLIPPRERYKVEYTVKKGDSFSRIAKKFKLSQDELFTFQAGKLSSRGKLRAGKTTLIIWQDGDVIPAFAPESEKGKLKYSARLRPQKAYYIKRPHNSYGTRGTVQLIAKVFERYRRKYKGPKVIMGDLSKKGGGHLAGHVSHQTGRDVDIGWVFKKGKGSTKRFVNGNATNLDVRRSWALVHGFLETEKVEFIFIDYGVQKLLYEEAVKRRVSKQKLAQWFQYPRPKARLYGIVRHWKGHGDHMHIRFRK